MAEPRTDGLPYGHFGVPLYDFNDKRWMFARDTREGQTWH